jgi:uncharacterized membrane protein YedE/YeeE
MTSTMLKAVLWVMAFAAPILLFFPESAAPNRSYAITFAAIAGGFLFGVGAAANGGCALSTLGHLANGNLWMLTTLFGFCIGVAGLSSMIPMTEHGQALTPLLSKAPKSLVLMGLALLWLLLCWKLLRLWRSRAKGSGWIQLFFKVLSPINRCLITGIQRGRAVCAARRLDIYLRVETPGTIAVAAH